MLSYLLAECCLIDSQNLPPPSKNKNALGPKLSNHKPSCRYKLHYLKTNNRYCWWKSRVLGNCLEPWKQHRVVNFTVPQPAGASVRHGLIVTRRKGRSFPRLSSPSGGGAYLTSPCPASIHPTGTDSRYFSSDSTRNPSDRHRPSQQLLHFTLGRIYPGERLTRNNHGTETHSDRPHSFTLRR